jgi:hypothetical protein
VILARCGRHRRQARSTGHLELEYHLPINKLLGEA